MSFYGSGSGAAAAVATGSEPLEPRRLELTLDPMDGSLRTVPLSIVLLAATDALYSDLYNMAHGELDVATATAAVTGDDDHGDDDNAPAATTTTTVVKKQERMSNLSFAQRRHELAWRLARHGKAFQHVAALTAAAATTDFTNAVAVSSTALQHARTAWVQADEAQDALYFFHDKLFPGRASPHDIYGACDVQLNGRWYDLCRDMRLTVDPYEASPEAIWSATEIDDRWQMAVRRKLLTGEVGWNRRQQQRMPAVLWKVMLRGGVVRLTQGVGKPTATATTTTTTTTTTKGTMSSVMYPIEALLTVVPSEQLQWTLISLDVRVQAKTGEFNHQLETSNRQRYDLHRLAALAMSRAERASRAAKLEAAKSQTTTTTEQDDLLEAKVVEDDDTPARPLHALFQVAHRFSLSWQLEMLSAQAQGLRRGVWAAGASNPIHVTPVKFFTDDDTEHDDEDTTDPNHKETVLGVMSISFWRVDDSYGPPSMENLSLEEDESSSLSSHPRFNPKYMPESTSQLVLSVQAVENRGIRVALSGAAGILEAMKIQPRIRVTVQELLEAASNPFALSASDALLAATKLCAERKCFAVVAALQPVDGRKVLPDWILVSVDHGSIAVGAHVQYYSKPDDSSLEVPTTPPPQHPPPILFRLVCDGRTGSFVPTFCRSFHLLRRLAANDLSETFAVRTASLPANRRRAAGANSTGRCVRDAFDGLVRCMNVLGHRAAVGGSFDDLDEQSPKLRQRSVQSACGDVRTALIKCCAMATLYGLAPLALATGFGLDAAPDLAGDSMDRINDIPLIAVPPVSIRLSQELVDTTSSTSDGVTKRSSYVASSFFSLSCAVNDGGQTLIPMMINVRLESPASVPLIQKCELLQFNVSTRKSDEEPCLNGNGGTHNSSTTMEDPVHEAGRLAEMLADLIDLESEGVT